MNLTDKMRKNIEEFKLCYKSDKQEKKNKEERRMYLEILMREEKLEKAKEKAELAEYKKLITMSSVKHLISLLLRRRVLANREMTPENDLGLWVNELTVYRLIDELAEEFGVKDPSSIIDNTEDDYLWDDQS